MSIKLKLKDFQDYRITSLFAVDYASDGQRKTLKIDVFIMSHIDYIVSLGECNYIFNSMKDAIEKFNEL